MSPHPRDPITGRMLPVPIFERIWAKLTEEDRGYATPCWIWHGGKTTLGYGGVWLEGQTRLVHRVVYELVVGPIPNGLELDHLCRQTLCVCPLHLEPVTTQENQHRSNSVSGINARKKLCRRGHPFTGLWRGKRTCRTCSMLRTREHRARMAA